MPTRQSGPPPRLAQAADASRSSHFAHTQLQARRQEAAAAAQRDQGSMQQRNHPAAAPQLHAQQQQRQPEQQQGQLHRHAPVEQRPNAAAPPSAEQRHRTPVVWRPSAPRPKTSTEEEEQRRQVRMRRLAPRWVQTGVLLSSGMCDSWQALYQGSSLTLVHPACIHPFIQSFNALVLLCPGTAARRRGRMPRHRTGRAYKSSSGAWGRSASCSSMLQIGVRRKGGSGSGGGCVMQTRASRRRGSGGGSDVNRMQPRKREGGGGGSSSSTTGA